MADGSLRALKDVRVGDAIVTYDPKTCDPSHTRVVAHMVQPTEKPMFRLTTASGRTIVATHDHKFLTSKGWVAVEHMTPGETHVGIYLPHGRWGAAPEEYLYRREVGAAPGLTILARLLGYTMARGNRWTFDRRMDMDLFLADLNVYAEVTQRADLNVRVPEDVTLVDSHLDSTLEFIIENPAWNMLLTSWSLEADGVPAWIKDAPNPVVQQEFLAGLQGGAARSIGVPFSTAFLPKKKPQKPFMQDLLDLYRREGIDVAPLQQQTSGWALELVDEPANIVHAFDMIGYRYAQRLTAAHGARAELLRSRHVKRDPPETRGMHVFVPVASITRVPQALIADLTTESKNHSFVAGDGFSVHNSAMGKQAISVYASNFRHRFDTVGHIINYPQRPLVSTQMSSLLHGNDLPSGINAIVAIATQGGYNQEDSVIMNQSAVDRGLFVSTVFKTYREQNNKNHSTGEEEFFCKPDHQTAALKPFNYTKLETDGFVPENTFVDAGDIIIGKCMPQKFGNTITNKDTSVVLKSNERGYVDRNCYNDNYFTTINGEGYSYAKVRIRHERCPTIGDKFSSRHGQKGTMGMSLRAEDMPFSSEGLVPDIIVNPHAIPSRMTIGQLMECILGTACVHYGSFGDATPFLDTTVEHIGDLLQRAGHERLGNHVLYNARTGEQITTTVFMGPTYYQRLKHMVEDKIHSRSSNGPVVLLTRQPAEGRARDGGLRLGEMEIECQWSHGMLHFLKERFMECSDNYRAFTCKKCGMFAVCNPDKKIFSCRHCKNITSFAEIRLPYACKLLMQEIQTMGIGARFVTD